MNSAQSNEQLLNFWSSPENYKFAPPVMIHQLRQTTTRSHEERMIESGKMQDLIDKVDGGQSEVMKSLEKKRELVRKDPFKGLKLGVHEKWENFIEMSDAHKAKWEDTYDSNFLRTGDKAEAARAARKAVVVREKKVATKFQKDATGRSNTTSRFARQTTRASTGRKEQQVWRACLEQNTTMMDLYDPRANMTGRQLLDDLRNKRSGRHLGEKADEKPAYKRYCSK